MEQQVRFCTTSDGVRIAYATVGQGPPLVFLPGWVLSHLEFGWTHPDVHAFYEGLASGRVLVRYDKRGTGLSDRNLLDFSMEALVRELETVVDTLELHRFALIGWFEGGPTAIAYACSHPERVSRLILYGTFHRWPYSREVMEPILGLVRSQWGMGSAALSSIVSGDPSQAASINEAQRVSVSAETAAAMIEAIMATDVTSLLRDIQVPTLVVHRRNDSVLPFSVAREMAALIPGARFHPLEGEICPPWWGDSRAILTAIDTFLEEDEKAAENQKEKLPSGTAVILFADIADSTALTEQLGDAAFRAKARELDTALRTATRECEGTPVEGKLLGDGVLAVFTSARQAIEAALRCGAAGESAGLLLHLGIHAGDVIREENNVFGGAVNIAARIAAASAAGEVLVSETVRGLARTSAGVTFDDRGEHELKGIAEPQRLFTVHEGGAHDSARPSTGSG